jgi:hypothetical protein
MPRNLPLRIVLASIVFAALAPALPASASSVTPLTVAMLAEYAGQVIVGDVVETRSYWAESPRRIESEVVFEHVEYLKGPCAACAARFTLTVPGGTVGDVTARLTDAPTFAAGERWMLFLLPEYKTFPVVGLSEGAFRVKVDAGGVQRVYDANCRPVAGIGADGLVQVTDERSARPQRSQLVGSTGLRVSLSPAGPAATEGLSYVEFVARLRPTLDASRDYGLTEPAGRRVVATHHAMPLQGRGGAPGQLRAGAGVAVESPSTPRPAPATDADKSGRADR